MKKIGILALVLVFVVGSLGVGYATWKDDVQIDATVQMNDFLVGILDGSVSSGDTEEESAIAGGYPYKDIGSCTVTLENSEDSVHHEPGVTVWHTMKIDVTKAYPSYHQWVNFKLKNAGTVPAHITLVEITGYDVTDGEVLVYDPDLGGLVDPIEGLIINLDIVKDWNENCIIDAGDEPLTACQQIDPCDSVPVCLEFHFKEAAEECHTYTFKIYIEAVQWNKA